jgi:phosphatidylserine/phosphatidylglycerophosphate/cardiolipin synthase-like enzyme
MGDKKTPRYATLRLVFLRPKGKNQAAIDEISSIISETQEELNIAIAYFTYKPFSDALLHRKKNNMPTRLIINGADIIRPAGARTSELVVAKPLLEILEQSYKWDFEVRSLGFQHGKYQNMHHKFIVSDKTAIWGSVNWTYSALHNNYECMTVSDNQEVILRFRREFEGLWNIAQEVMAHNGKLRAIMCPNCQESYGVDFESYGPFCRFCNHRFSIVEAT